jgi:hypothetical protein
MPDIASRSETITQIMRLIRFAVLTTLGLMFVLLAVDILSGGAKTPDWRFLSERVLVTLVLAIAGEVVIGIMAVTCLTLWPPQAASASTQSG